MLLNAPRPNHSRDINRGGVPMYMSMIWGDEP